jgi:pimeloyl-ACP methyl ester carboxylesterase
MSWKKRLLCLAGVVVAVALAGGIGFWMRPLSCFNGAMYLGERFSGVENHTVQVAGRRMHYLAQGPASGPVVVLVHGLGGRAEDWQNLTPYFVQAGFRVYRPDLPGYGRSDKPTDFSYSVHDEAEMVVGFLDALGIKQVDLGGWSMGGGIVQHVAFRHPERVRRLMLFDAVGIYEMPKWDVRLFTPTTPAELDQLDALLMPHPPVVPGFVARDILRQSQEGAWVIHRAVDAMRTGQDATNAMLPRLKMPVLVVWGAEDKIFPVSQAETMHRLIPQSELAIIPGCGHLAPGQCADQIGPSAVAFVKR